MAISIRLIDCSCMEKLLEFELINREHFEETCPSRGDDYYIECNFKSILNELIKEVEEGLAYMYLVFNEANEIVGRVNLVNITDDEYRSAELGYRIGKAYTGKGYGTEGVKLILEEAKNKYNIHKVYAGTSPENISSQRVLINNNFKYIKKESNYIKLNGKHHDNCIYEIIL